MGLFSILSSTVIVVAEESYLQFLYYFLFLFLSPSLPFPYYSFLSLPFLFLLFPAVPQSLLILYLSPFLFLWPSPSFSPSPYTPLFSLSLPYNYILSYLRSDHSLAYS